MGSWKRKVKRGALAVFSAAGIATFAPPLIYSACIRDDSPRYSVNTAAPEKLLEDTVRIGTYNIAHGRGPVLTSKYQGWGDFLEEYGLNIQLEEAKKYFYLDKIVEEFEKINPDILLLNEIDFKTSTSHNVDQVRYLAEKLGMRYYAYGTEWNFYSLFYHEHSGNAILSKFPFKVENHFFHDKAREWIAGGFSYMKILVGDITIFHTHLDSNSQKDRNLQARMLKEHLDDIKGLKLVTGDLNSEPNTENDEDFHISKEKVFETLLGDGTLLRYGSNTDWTTKIDGDRNIDHILIDSRMKYNSCFVPKIVYSDHYPFVCDIILSITSGKK